MPKTGKRSESHGRFYRGKRVSGWNGKRRSVPRERRRRRRLTGKELLILLVPAAAAILAVVLNSFLARDAMQYVLEKDGMQYYAGGRFPVQTGTVLRRTRKDVTEMQTASGRSEAVTSLPIYYPEERTVVFPQNMVYYEPRNNACSRLDYFYEVLCRQDGAVFATRKDKSIILNKGFLYDGADFYLFLEPMTVEFNGYRLDLPALSYVEAVYQGTIMAFDFGLGEFLMESPTGPVTATSLSGDYTVSLLNDSMMKSDGSKSLLFTRPDLLEPLE